MADTALPASAIVQLDAAGFAAELDGLCDLLAACVAGGASVNFLMPFGRDAARRFWTEKVLAGVDAGTLTVLVASVGGRVAGSVQLDRATPPNQPHRAEVRKLLVHPDFRRRGIARTLMAEIERQAVRCGRTLLTLDTVTGGKAEPLYTALGYRTAGVIPGYARDPIDGHLDATTIMYKTLQAAAI